jgi:transcriptional regulator with XRE-family HTH domain
MHVDEEKSIDNEFDVVDAEQAESVIGQKAIGERIRRLRMRRSMGLVELGKKTDLSASFLSQLETGRVVPTVRNLARIAMAFNKDLSYFFREDVPVNFRVLRQSERVRLQRVLPTGSNFLSENLSALITDASMVPCIAEFRATTEEVVFHPRIFEGIEFTLVVKGTLTLVSENETRVLETGDVAWLDSIRKRSYTCQAGDYARAIIITRNRRS